MPADPPIPFWFPADAETAAASVPIVEHHCDYGVDDTGSLMYHYNFFVYRWELADEVVAARAYVDEFNSVSVFVRNTRLRSDPSLAAIVHYLQQRFEVINSFHADDVGLSDRGYAPAFLLTPP
jgi:hypothetical protein